MIKGGGICMISTAFSAELTRGIVDISYKPSIKANIHKQRIRRLSLYQICLAIWGSKSFFLQHFS